MLIVALRRYYAAVKAGIVERDDCFKLSVDGVFVFDNDWTIGLLIIFGIFTGFTLIALLVGCIQARKNKPHGGAERQVIYSQKVVDSNNHHHHHQLTKESNKNELNKDKDNPESSKSNTKWPGLFSKYNFALPQGIVPGSSVANVAGSSSVNGPAESTISADEATEAADTNKSTG